MLLDQWDGGGVEKYLHSQSCLKKKSSIFKVMQEQQQIIWYQVCACREILNEPIMIDDSDNKKALE